MRDRERAIHWGILLSSLAVCGWVFGTARAEPPRVNAPVAAKEVAHDARTPLSLLPPGSAFVLTADMARLQRTPLGGLLAQRLARAGGTTKLTTLCGFDPLSRLDQLALAVPSAGRDAQEHPEDFGIVASGRIDAAEIMRCASAAITDRSGEAIETRVGSFSTVRDRKSEGEVAARDGGPLIFSGGAYFRGLLDAAEGHSDPRPDARDQRHAELRRALGPGTLLATWIPSEGWLQHVASEETNARLSPLAGLQALGARIEVNDAVHVLVLLDCGDSESAARVSSLLNELRSSLDALPVDPALSSVSKRVSLSQTGARLKLGLDLGEAELSALSSSLLGP